MKYLFSTDVKKTRSYWVKSIKSKFVEKERLQKKYKLIEDKKSFFVWITLPLTKSNNSEVLISALEWILELWINVVLLASAEKAYQKPVDELKKKYWDSILLIDDNEESERDIYALCDSVLFLKSDSDKVESSLSYWAVPIVVFSKDFDSDLLRDFDPLLEKWNSLVVNWNSHWNVIEWVVRAKETFKFSYDWNLLRTNCSQSVNE